MIVEFESTNSVQSKYKPKKPCQNLSKFAFSHFPIVSDISIKKSSIVLTSIINTPDPKKKKQI